MKEKLQEWVANSEKLSGENMDAFMNMNTILTNTGALDKKYKHLIGLALAVKSQCDWCIAIHTKKCLEEGLTKQEIIEGCWVAVLMGGGPSLMYMQLVEKAIEELS